MEGTGHRVGDGVNDVCDDDDVCDTHDDNDDNGPWTSSSSLHNVGDVLTCIWQTMSILYYNSEFLTYISIIGLLKNDNMILADADNRQAHRVDHSAAATRDL